MKKRVLITGASRGIGEALALELAKKGYALYLTCNNSYEDLTGVKERIIKEYQVECEIFRCDAKNPDEVKMVYEKIRSDKKADELVAVVNNAAVSYVGLLQDMSVSDWNHIIDTNLNSIFYSSKEAVDIFIKKHEGRIINVSSIWGNVGGSMEVAYSAAKGGVNSFTKALAKELAPNNIQVNAVAFGVIDTKMNSCFSQEDMEALAEEIPAGRIGTAEEAARMIVGVLEAPEYLTGQIITMDGGFT